MFRSSSYTSGFEIRNIASCDFSKLERVTNDQVLERGGRKVDPRLSRFLSEEMGIEQRFLTSKTTNALDLARDALSALLHESPQLRDDAEFLIFAGISNPMPTVCLSALLSHEFELPRVSCWDIKSGCSTGVLGLAQALDWFQHGAKAGILVASETFSKFTNPKTLELAASTGDGACAISLYPSTSWAVRGVVHGTDSEYFKSAYVPGTYPIDLETYHPSDYVFAFDDKPKALTTLGHYWVQSLRDLLSLSKIDGNQVTHYVSHQVDASKNRAFAQACGINSDAIALNFRDYGNMGCPTVLLNYLRFIEQRASFKVGDVLVFHAVGGGISYAGICLEKIA